MSYANLNELRMSIGDHNYEKISMIRPGPKETLNSQRYELSPRKVVPFNLKFQRMAPTVNPSLINYDE